MSVEHEGEELRVLVIGQDSRVLGFVVDEIRAANIPASGVIVGEVDKARNSPYDLVAFGAGVPPELRAELERDFRVRNPSVRFLGTYAPYAAAEVVQAVRSPQSGPLVDLRAYCKRIAYDGPLEPTLTTLRKLQAHHIASIPFEAIDVILGRGIDLSPTAVDAKLLGTQRGGYCYEQNSLFSRVLREIGFQVDSLAASVRWMAAPGTPPPPRSHRTLRVLAEGVHWLVDVGFGVSVPPAPLRLDTSEPQETVHETYRIIPLGAGLLVQALIAGKWQPLYDFLIEPLLENHYEIPNWFASTHPTSPFRRQLIAARTKSEARYSLLGSRLTVRHRNGRAQRWQLDAAAIKDALRTHFLIEPQEDWDDMLARAASLGP